MRHASWGSQVCLMASTFAGPGLHGCAAGEPARFEIRARDARGHAVPEAEAAFIVEVFAGDERITGRDPTASALFSGPQSTPSGTLCRSVSRLKIQTHDSWSCKDLLHAIRAGSLHEPALHESAMHAADLSPVDVLLPLG